MGLFGGFFSSDSKNETTNVTNTTDNRIAAQSGAAVVSGGGDLTIENLSDEVAVASIEQSARAAREISQEAIRQTTASARNSLDFASDVVDTAAGSVERFINELGAGQRENARLAESLATVSIENLEKNKRDPDSDLIQSVGSQLSQTVMLGVLVLGVVLIVNRKQ